MAQLFIKNISTKWQSNLIDIESALLVLGAQPLDQAKNWFVYFDNGSDCWVNLLACHSILEKFKPTSMNIVPKILMPETAAVQVVNSAPSTTKEEIILPQDFFTPEKFPEINVEEEASLMVQEEIIEPETIKTVIEVVKATEPQGAERRQYQRFDIKLRVIIKSGKNTYMTYTRDVSLGGLSLLNDLPDSVYNQEAEIYITAPDQKNNIKFICSPVPSKLGKSRLMFTQIEESKQKVLAAWLNHFVKPNSQKAS